MDLLRWIKLMRDQGFTEDQIKGLLERDGHEPKEVEAFLAAKPPPDLPDEKPAERKKTIMVIALTTAVLAAILATIFLILR